MNSSQLDLLLLLPTDGQPVEVCFSHTVILNNDPSSFMEAFSWRRLQDPELLRRLHGRVRFRFEGYMGDPRGFEQIPELRTFLRDWHRAWPAWFFFADLAEETPRRMALACLPELQVVARAGAPTAQVSFRSRDLMELMSPELLFLQVLSFRAGLSLAQAAARARAVWTYVGLPPDAFPAHRWPTTLP
jgi:hypothetical protein